MSGPEHATLTSSSEHRLRTLSKRAGTAAMARGFSYAVVSLSWLPGLAGMPGGRIGVDRLAATIRDEAQDPTPSFIALLLVAIIARALAGCPGLVLRVPLDQIVSRRLLLTRGWVAGWYLGLWEPLWLIGGLASLVATRARRLTSAPDRSPYRG